MTAITSTSIQIWPTSLRISTIPAFTTTVLTPCRGIDSRGIVAQRDRCGTRVTHRCGHSTVHRERAEYQCSKLFLMANNLRIAGYNPSKSIDPYPST